MPEVRDYSIGPLQLTAPEKPYYAQANAKVAHDGRESTVVYIAFKPGDTTGGDRTFEEGQLRMHPLMITPPHRAIDYYPQRKEPVSSALEVMLPTLTVEKTFDAITADEKRRMSHENAIIRVIRGHAPLDLLTIDDSSSILHVQASHALGGRNYVKMGDVFIGEESRPHMTIGYSRDGKRFGDPHAVTLRPQGKQMIAIAGFMAFSPEEARELRPNDPLYRRILRETVEPAENIKTR